MVEDVKAEALRRVDDLPKNWRNIRWAIETAIEEGEVRYLNYMPRGRASYYKRNYDRVWKNLGDYAKEVGIILEYQPGPRGGLWTSKWIFKGVEA